MPTSAVIIGSLNMDLVTRVERMPLAGETMFGAGFTLAEGGKGANQAAASARLGAEVAMIGRVGQDGFGEQLRRALAKDGVNTDHVRNHPELPTGVATILVDISGENRIILEPGANLALSRSDIDAAADRIGQAEFVVLQLEVPMAAVTYAISLAAAAGKRVILNPAPASDLPASAWPAVNYLIPNETEAGWLTGIKVNSREAAIAAGQALRRRGAQVVLITLGAQGVLICDAAGERLLPARPVKVQDTTAAGDCFIGGVTAGLCEGMAIDEAAELGIAAASLCVMRAGAQPALPFRRELLA